MALSLDELIERELGSPTRPVRNPLISSIGTTAGQLLRANPQRVAFTLVNLSSGTIYLGLDNEVSSTVAFASLGPNGAGVNLNYKEDYHVVGYDWWVVGSGAGLNLHVLEVVTV